VRLERPERAPHDEERGEHAARRPRSEGHGPDHRLGHHQADQRHADELPGEEVVDGVVADAQRAGIEQTAKPDHRAAQEGPPHPVYRNLAKQVLARIDEPREQPRSEAGGDPEGERDDEPVRGQRGVWRHRKEGSRAEQGHAQRARDRRGAGHGDEAARLPLEQEQLHSEQRRGQRRAEHRGHPTRCAGDEQGLPFRRRQMERLAE